MRLFSTARWSAFVVTVACAAGAAFAEDWPQFRGIHSGRATTGKSYPTEIGPDAAAVWKVALPPGHSSPVVSGDRIFLAAVRDGQLLTMALDRATGKTLWEQPAPHEKLEEIHRIGSHAQCTPAADEECVISFFGSSGLSAHTRDGKLLWRHRMGPFKNDFGAGSSPILVGDMVILCQDHDVGSFIAAWDKKTGKQLWRTDRPDFFRNYCTPTVWEVNGRRQIVVAATLRVVGYDLETGKEAWTISGISRVVCLTPSVGDDGMLYVAGWSAGGGDEGQRIALEPFDTVLPMHDKDKNGTLEDAELPKGDLKQRFTQADRDKDGHITKAEYEDFRGLFDKSKNTFLAVKPAGDATKTEIAWQYDRNVPFCSSPVYYEGMLFAVKDGGILTCLDAKTGKPLKAARLPATGEYYSSPVAGDGKIYLLNEDGQLTVISAKEKWEVLHSAEFGEGGYATPALADGRIYLRTAGHLYCFGN